MALIAAGRLDEFETVLKRTQIRSSDIDTFTFVYCLARGSRSADLFYSTLARYSGAEVAKRPDLFSFVAMWKEFYEDGSVLHLKLQEANSPSSAERPQYRYAAIAEARSRITISARIEVEPQTNLLQINLRLDDEAHEKPSWGVRTG